MHDYYEDTDDFVDTKKSKIKIFNILIPLLIVAIIVTLILLLVGNKPSQSYSYYEKKMVDQAKKYVKSNNIDPSKEIYLDVLKIEASIPLNCSNTSGVIYNGEDYIPYLSCGDYESKVIENDNKGVSLLGDSLIILIKGTEYVEPGYISNLDVIESGQVEMEEGIYNIYYLTSNGNATRKVIVINNPALIASIPKMELIGNSSEVIDINTEYNDSFVNVIDNIDKNIATKVVKNSNINTSKAGTYSIVYTVKNSLGYKNYITRKVILIDKNVNINIIDDVSPKTLTRDEVSIIINIYSNEYLHTILPNGERESSSNIQYKVKENGIYDFTVVDKNGNIATKKVEVNNIYRKVPTATCKATIKNDGTTIKVESTSTEVELSYNYVIDGIASGYKISDTYKSSNNNPQTVEVRLLDSVGNENIITCDKEDKKTTFNPNGYTQTLRTSARITVPIATALAKKGYSVYDLNTCIYNRVMKAGPGTRYGVVEAGYGLIDCTYSMLGAVLSYNHESGKVEGTYCAYNSDICGKLGINTRWGSKGGVCGEKTINGECYHGMNCATFVGWAMCNGGMDMCTKRSSGAPSMATTKYFPGADGVTLVGKKVTYYSGNDLTGYGADTLIRMIKPGDVVQRVRMNDTDGSSQHIFLVVGMDSTGIYAANDGYYVNKYSYSSMTSGEMKFRILFLDNYYANAANKNHLYPE